MVKTLVFELDKLQFLRVWVKLLLIQGLEGYRGIIPHIPNLLLLKYLDQGIFSSTICCVTPLFTNTYQKLYIARRQNKINYGIEELY